jgi:NAD+ kinase
MKTFGIIYNPYKEKAKKSLQKIKEWLEKRKCKAVAIPSTSPRMPEMDFAVTLGGDGTMLMASRTLAPKEIPVLGVNLGSLGFLAETDQKEVFSLLEGVIADKYRVEERLMLSIEFTSGKERSSHLALNDCIIHAGANGRVVRVQAMINTEFVADYIGDGLIVSTPTGSTAYSLAASGPIVHPGLPVFVMTPICPHTLTQRPLIISSSEALTLNVITKHHLDKPIISIDGQINYSVGMKDQINISLYEKPLRLISNPKRKYFQVLRRKLKWGERG